MIIIEFKKSPKRFQCIIYVESKLTGTVNEYVERLVIHTSQLIPLSCTYTVHKNKSRTLWYCLFYCKTVCVVQADSECDEWVCNRTQRERVSDSVNTEAVEIFTTLEYLFRVERRSGTEDPYHCHSVIFLYPKHLYLTINPLIHTQTLTRTYTEEYVL